MNLKDKIKDQNYNLGCCFQQELIKNIFNKETKKLII